MSKRTRFEGLDLVEAQREEDQKHWKLLLIVRGGQDKQQTRRFTSETATEVVFQAEGLQIKLDPDGKVLIRPEDPKTFKIELEIIESIGEEMSKKAQIKLMSHKELVESQE
ncbi:MAG: hypothetical protein ACFFCZ_20820 [Promethearchaeota archaeon]